ncbi:MAG: serine hydrolase domain-containing protein [Opitutus sp.]
MNLPRSSYFLAALALATAASLRAADTKWPLPTAKPADEGISAARLEIAHKALDRYVDEGKYAGYVAFFSRNGKIVDWHAHGSRDVAGGKPMERDTIARIYSNSKVITAVAVLTLLEQDKLKLSDPIEKYLPALKDRQVLVGGTADAPQLAPAKRKITILNLLNQTSGFYYPADYSAGNDVAIELFRRANVWEADNLEGFIQRLAALPVLDEPGVRFRYGINLDILGAIVEKASGERFDHYLDEHIFKPLGMRDTAFWVPDEKKDRLSLLYNTDASGKLVAVPPLSSRAPKSDGTGVQSGGGGLFSTSGDYARFAQMLLNGGELDGVRILSRTTIELMRQNHLGNLAYPHPFDREDRGYGLGVQMVTDLGRSTMLGSEGMWGWDGAASTICWIDPKEKTTLIMITQRLPFNAENFLTAFVDVYYSSFDD